MKVSGFTIVRNARRYDYPIEAAIQSILPVCDEFIVNVGDSDDGTLEAVKAIQDPKIKIFERTWDMNKGGTVLSEETNFALEQCQGDWAFYIQADEVVHERDLGRLRFLMEKYLNDPSVDALRFEWLHFYGSYFRYRDDDGWFQKQDRIIRNNGTIRSIEDAYSFRHKDATPLRSKKTGCFLYHYGWVHEEAKMGEKFRHLQKLGIVKNSKAGAFSYEDLKRFPIYFGSHPAGMKERIGCHSLTGQDRSLIRQRYWWHPLLWIPVVRFKRHRGLRRKVVQST